MNEIRTDVIRKGPNAGQLVKRLYMVGGDKQPSNWAFRLDKRTANLVLDNIDEIKAFLNHVEQNGKANIVKQEIKTKKVIAKPVEIVELTPTKTEIVKKPVSGLDALLAIL